MDQKTRILIANSLLAAAAKLDDADEFDPQAVAVANETSRTLGAVGARAVVPRIIRGEGGFQLATPEDRILDFGAGKDAAHAKRLINEGYNVTAYDFGKNVNPEIHDPEALEHGPYDVVYASNVLNVQSSLDMLRMTLRQIRDVLAPGGVFIGNYPDSPRKMNATPKDVADVITELFGSEPLLTGIGKTPSPPRKVKGEVVYPAEPVFIVRR